MDGMKIKEIRTRKKMSQERLSELMDVGRPIIGGWERGYITPSEEEYQKLAQIFKVSTEVLKGFE